jgi:hypothetical protein
VLVDAPPAEHLAVIGSDDRLSVEFWNETTGVFDGDVDVFEVRLAGRLTCYITAFDLFPPQIVEFEDRPSGLAERRKMRLKEVDDEPFVGIPILRVECRIHHGFWHDNRSWVVVLIGPQLADVRRFPQADPIAELTFGVSHVRIPGDEDGVEMVPGAERLFHESLCVRGDRENRVEITRNRVSSSKVVVPAGVENDQVVPIPLHDVLAGPSAYASLEPRVQNVERLDRIGKPTTYLGQSVHFLSAG